MLIERPPQWFRRLYPEALFRMPTDNDRKIVFLTFDDGPVPEVTPWVLDVLEEFGVKATFFMVGQNVERYPSLLQLVREKGHSVGSHTLHHLQGIRTNRKKYIEDCEKGAELTASLLFRPPHGLIKRSQLKSLSRKYRIIMYDLVTRDYSKKLSAEDVTNNVKRYSRDGSIIVFHDSIKSFPRLREALPGSLRWLKEQGYSFGLL